MSSSQSTEFHQVTFIFDHGVKLTYSWPSEEIKRLRLQYKLKEPDIWICPDGIIDLNKVLSIRWPRNADRNQTSSTATQVPQKIEMLDRT